jgi:hypothetical protein
VKFRSRGIHSALAIPKYDNPEPVRAHVIMERFRD